MAVYERLQAHRRARGMSIPEVGKATGLHQRKLASFEKVAAPDAESLAILADFYNADPELLALDIPLLDVSAVSDQVDKLDDAEIDQIGAQTQLWLERYRLIEAQMPPDQRRLLGFPDGFPHKAESPKDAALAADAVRHQWQLSTLTPVSMLADLLESLGVRIGFIAGVPRLSALAMLTTTAPQMPLIVVRRDLSGDAQRFAIARELAYFLLEGCTTKLAGHFAGSLLVPADALTQDVGSGRTDFELYELAMLKEKYGVSMRHILARAAALRLISAETHQRWLSIFEAQGWNSVEPGKPYPPEESRRMLRHVMRLQVEGKVGVEQAARLLDMTFDEWATRLTLDGALSYEVA